MIFTSFLQVGSFRFKNILANYLLAKPVSFDSKKLKSQAHGFVPILQLKEIVDFGLLEVPYFIGDGFSLIVV